MKHLRSLLVLGILSAPGFGAEPCARALEGTHETALLGGAASELAFQTECLLWETTLQPKAELLPPAAIGVPARPLPGGIVRVRTTRPASLQDLLAPAPSFRLGEPAALLGPALGAPTTHPRP
jgi:hypothetical protein